MMALESHKAFLNSYFPMDQGMVKLPGSFIFAGRLLWIIALQVAVSSLFLPQQSSFSYSVSPSEILHNSTFD